MNDTLCMCCIWKGLLSRLGNVGQDECSLKGECTCSVQQGREEECTCVHVYKCVCGMRRGDACLKGIAYG